MHPAVLLPLLTWSAAVDWRTTGGASPPFKDCEYEGGGRAKPGEQFELGCAARCTCDKGGSGSYGCVPLCGLQQLPADCREVRDLGRCCRRAECPKDVDPKKCLGADAALKADTPAPWRVTVRTGDKVCPGTLVTLRHIYASVNCVSEKSDVQVSGAILKIKSMTRSNGEAPNLVTARLNGTATVSAWTHEINAAPRALCDQFRTQPCALLVGYFDRAVRRPRTMVARPAADDRCPVRPKDGQVRCLELLSRPVGCKQLDGESVSVRLGDTVYLVGLVAEGQSCDDKASGFVAYRDMCVSTAAAKFQD